MDDLDSRARYLREQGFDPAGEPVGNFESQVEYAEERLLRQQISRELAKDSTHA